MSQGFTQALPIPLPVSKGGTGQTSSSGSGAVILQTSPTITTPNIVGVTDASNASAGSVGEVISSQLTFGSRTALTTATSKNITTISLTAGDWDVSGGVFVDNDSTALYEAFFWASTTSATIPDISLVAGVTSQNTAAARMTNISGAIQPLRVSVNSTTTVYLSARATFTAGNTNGSGYIIARRVR